jgi:hypothetical protein
MSLTDFYEATLGETFEYIYERGNYEKQKMENEWKVMRWQSTLLLNMMASKGKRYQPTDLFTFEDEEKAQGKRKVAIDSPEAEEVFKRMEEKYKQRWQSKLAM